MNKIILNIGGMSCSGCSRGLEKYLNRKEGIKNASVNLVLAQALIEYDNSITVKDLEEFIKDAGFESLGEYKEVDLELKNKREKKYLIIYIIPIIFIMYITMNHMLPFREIPFINKNNPIIYTFSLFILTLPFLIYGYDIFKSGIKSLIHKTPNMDTLVTIGVFTSYLYSIYCMIIIILGHNGYIENLYFESSAMIIYFIKLGRYIDGRNREKTKDAIKELVQITPDIAIIKKKNGEKKVTIDEVKKNDILISRPGQKIAVDGIIIDGKAHFEESFITGESTPIKKKKDDKVIAGSINIDGYVEYKALKIGKDSTISSIVRLVVEATNTKMPIARLADIVCSYFVPVILIIAFITFIGCLVLGINFSESLNTFVTVLVVACPCALGLATPLAIVVSEGLCAKNGILVRNSKTLEAIYKIDTVVFDKTGTLTYGNLKISKIINYSNYSNDELIEFIASLEAKSTHPIAKAFTDYLKDKRNVLLNVENFKNIVGVGIAGNINGKKLYIGNNKLLEKLKIENTKIRDEVKLRKDNNTHIYVIENNNIIALIGVKDIVRDNAKHTITKLKRMKKETIMLTGDNETVSQSVAKVLGIRKVYANSLPNDKTKLVKNLISNNKNVMMVGDGINDAPVLATANVGVSVKSGTDIALNSADVILLQDNLEGIVTLIEISKRTIKNIKQNLFWAFFYNICMIPIAMGLLKPFNITINPMLASFSMTLSSLTVVFNALRLKKYKENKKETF